MFQVPVTYIFEFPQNDSNLRRYLMHEFAANGAEHLVLTNSMIGWILNDYKQADVLRAELCEAGLSFVDAHAPFGPDIDLNVKDPVKRGILLALHEASLRIAADMGVDTITIHVGNNVHGKNYPLSEHMDCVKRSLDKLLPLAETLGMTICIENIWYPTNQPEQLLSLKEAFPTDALGFCYDSGHANLMSEANRKLEKPFPLEFWLAAGIPQEQIPWDSEILEKMLPHVVNCHLHDNDTTWDQHRNIGHGTIDWKHIVPLLKRAPRLKCIQSEVIPVREMESIHSICQAFERLGEL